MLQEGGVTVKKRTTEEFKNMVRDLVDDEYSVLGEYETTLTNIHMRHNKCGTDFYPTPARFLAGSRCPKCRSSHQPKTEEKFISELPKGYTLVGHYINAKTKVLIRHESCGYEWYTNPSTIIKGHGCPKCANNIKKTREELQFEISDYEILGEYKTNKDKILTRCKQCGCEWNIRPNDLISGYGCPECAKHVSNKEKEVRDFIESLGFTPEYNVRDVIPPKELDIYIPEKKVAIEFNGNYWHGDNQKPKDYHYKKSQECEEKDIRLIHVFEYEWDNERQRPILENIIKHALGITEGVIYARKCKIEERESASMRDFFDKNNIQGFRGGQKAICLVYDGEVVMSYIVGKCFFHKSPSYEIIRGATKLGYTVVGGASKLWKYIINKWNDLPILYYIDYNYFNGSSMSSLKGLKFVKTTLSFKNYWVKHWKTGEENIIKNREPMYHKQVMKAQAENLGWPIYNAGTKTYIYNP